MEPRVEYILAPIFCTVPIRVCALSACANMIPSHIITRHHHSGLFFLFNSLHRVYATRRLWHGKYMVLNLPFFPWSPGSSPATSASVRLCQFPFFPSDLKFKFLPVLVLFPPPPSPVSSASQLPLSLFSLVPLGPFGMFAVSFLPSSSFFIFAILILSFSSLHPHHSGQSCSRMLDRTAGGSAGVSNAKEARKSDPNGLGRICQSKF